MLVLGFDTGPTKTAYAVLENDDNTYITSGIFESSKFPEFWKENETMLGDKFGVVVETPAGFGFSGARVAMLLETAVVSGSIFSFFSWSKQVDVKRLTAGQIRKETMGRASSTDNDTKYFLEMNVKNFPKRTNSHTRDALLACFAH